jgi:hypothetical protein
MTTCDHLDLARRQIAAARTYTLSLLEGLDDRDWFGIPADSPTHLAWQLGHLAMAEYGLCLFRVRGRRPEDLELMPSRFRKQFSRGSTPDGDAADYLPPAQIRAVFDRIHEQTLRELAECPPAVLDEPCEEPHVAFPTKLGALFFCAHHEMLHAGQIGLLRRLLGKPPIR